jgi:folate-dependent phosphoribosylglycinamide formyltransferase PurN
MAMIALLTTDSDSGRIAARYLADRFPALIVIIECPVSRTVLLRRRARRLGLVKVAGQLVFMALQRLQAQLAQARIAEITQQLPTDDGWPDGALRVPSVNSAECVECLAARRPAAVLVVGTRLIESAVLRRIGVPFINYHAGITPKYRGVHGGYWALAQGDAANCGVTVHLVDEGIDTGAVLYQERIAPSHRDNFSTYPYLQLATALPLLERAARDAIADALKPRAVELPSRLWSHPTIWSYFATGFRRAFLVTWPPRALSRLRAASIGRSAPSEALAF